MSTRKIRLSKKLTIRFRDFPMPVAEAFGDTLSTPDAPRAIEDSEKEGQDHASSEETFNSLPDLLPEIFLSQTVPPTPNLTYSVGDYSTCTLWETSFTTEVIPLAPNPDWLFADTVADNSIQGQSSDTHSDLQSQRQSQDTDSITRTTKIGVRDNLRRVQAYSPHTSIVDIERDLEFDSASSTAKHAVRENLRTLQTYVPCEAMTEFLREPDPFEFDGNLSDLCVDSYLMLGEDVPKGSPFEEPIADKTGESSRLTSLSQLPDNLQVPFDKHHGVKKSTRRRISTYHAGISYVSGASTEIKKQKRSTVRKRGRPSASKMKWLAETADDRLNSNEGVAKVEYLNDSTQNKVKKARKSRRRKVAVSTISILPGERTVKQSGQPKRDALVQNKTIPTQINSQLSRRRKMPS